MVVVCCDWIKEDDLKPIQNKDDNGNYKVELTFQFYYNREVHKNVIFVFHLNFFFSADEPITIQSDFKGIVHFEINFWYVLAYLKGIQGLGVFVSEVVSILIFLGQTVLVCQSYNAGLWSPP